MQTRPRATTHLAGATGEPYVFRTIIEPFRVKAVEPVRMISPEERADHIQTAGYNVFKLSSADVLIDLLTDSGTGAMSSRQWSGIMRGDESYAGSPSYVRFEQSVQEMTGFPHVIPTHQGRAAERILFSVMCKAGDIVPNNTHFDTTRANIEYLQATALDLPCEESHHLETKAPFKGNMDVAALEKLFEEHGRDRIPLVMMTVTNNSNGGQPVSLQNVRDVAAVCKRYERPLYLDACRIAENAWFIKMREAGQQERSVSEIIREMCSYAEGCTMSAKKDGLANIGGFLATRDEDVARAERDLLILTEGFPTYGGLAGRDLEAIAVGLEEVVQEDYLAYRIGSTAYLGENLVRNGVPILEPPGGHAIYLDASRFAPHLTPQQLPGISIGVALYVLSGVRSVEIGTAMFGRHDPKTGEEIAAPHELVRMAIPRRTYTQSHIDYVIEAVTELYRRREDLVGYRFVSQSHFLRHFTANYAPEV
jgi:tryptophanase